MLVILLKFGDLRCSNNSFELLPNSFEMKKKLDDQSVGPVMPVTCYMTGADLGGLGGSAKSPGCPNFFFFFALKLQKKRD